MAQKYIFRKFQKKSFRIRSNTILNTKHAKYESLTPPELGARILRQQSAAFFLGNVENADFLLFFLSKSMVLVKTRIFYCLNI